MEPLNKITEFVNPLCFKNLNCCQHQGLCTYGLQCYMFLPAQGPPRLGVVFVVVQAKQQLSQVRVYLVVANTGENLEEERGLTAEALQITEDQN